MENSTTMILRDIHDLDAIPWWPPAPGWWIVFGLLALLLAAAGLRYWLRYSGLMPGWRGDARRQLRALRKALRKEEPRTIAGRLSTLLRRIAMARAGRRQAAGLSGDRWLSWLEENDTSGFSWTQRGRILLQAPYMPPAWVVERKDVARLVAAARRWVDTVTPADRRPRVRWREKLAAYGLVRRSSHYV
ncbi:MAG: DUF4381 domain-containing protein [Gammaproteobacteria bacterium]|jgi:hypothetical protein